MPQSIFIQVGQCGNQVGFRFWDIAMKEYESCRKSFCEEEIDHFFKVKNDFQLDKSLEDSLKARSVLIDMEEGVISEGFRGHLRKLFSHRQIVTDVSGSGNNWAVGNRFYGVKYKSSILNLVRKEVEDCNSLQCFLLAFSMGGGTGSGLGTAVLEYLHSEYPNVPRFVFGVFPSAIDDVITSPYNALLANSELIEHASCIVPFENEALNDVCVRLEKNQNILNAKSRMKSARSGRNSSKPFDEMNNLIARTILDITSSSRFRGTLNLDLNDIIVNMTPFQKLHYLVPSISPVSLQNELKIEHLFNDVFSDSHQLFHSSLKRGELLSAVLLGRGEVTVTDIQQNISRLQGNVKFVPWNENGWKLGLCNIPQSGYKKSLLLLVNTSSISDRFLKMKKNFNKMYQRKAHIHHFTEFDPDIDDRIFNALYNLTKLIYRYKAIETYKSRSEISRLHVI